MIANTKNKILFITSAYPRRKGEQRDMFIYDLADRLSEHDDIFVLAPLDKNSARRETYNRVQVVRHPQMPFNFLRIAYGSGILPNIKKNVFLTLSIPFYFIFQLLYIRKMVKEFDINVIHAHWLIPNGLVAAIYKKFFNNNIKLIVTIHGGDLFSLNNKMGRKLKDFTLKYTDEITVVSNALKLFLLKNYKWNRQVYVYPMGTDTAIFKPLKEENHSSVSQVREIKLLFVGRIIKGKGIDVIIEALPEIVLRFPEIILTIIGEGNLKRSIQDRIKELGIIDHVEFLGSKKYTELPVFYADTDLFLFPSRSEGFGLVLAEAMSCGSLVLSNNIEAVQDIVDNNINGFLLSELDSKILPESVASILALSPAFKVEVKKAARKKIVENFDLKIVAENYRKLYQTVLLNKEN